VSGELDRLDENTAEKQADDASSARRVALSRRIQELVSHIEEHNRALRDNARSFPNSELGGLSVDDFCDLEARLEIEREIQEANLAS